MRRVVISCGPIPARVDSVKFLTNRFKGGLAFKTAKYLSEQDNIDLTIVKWKHCEFPHPIEAHIVDINDVVEYYDWFIANARKYNAFVMAGAVANLMPSNPYKGKFPSHDYAVGEKFNIEFEIAPRAIDVIKALNPRACLIGYKLFDAKTDKELIEIAKHTLKDSKANVIFANTPSTAKNKKIALTQDGATIFQTFDQHLDFMLKAINAKYFKTNSIKSEIPFAEKALVKQFEKSIDGHGTIAVKVEGDIITTSRGHRADPVLVWGVGMYDKNVYATNKATMNIPLLFKLLTDERSTYDYVIHRHEVRDCRVFDYEFPGTIGEYELAEKVLSEGISEFMIKDHGYIKLYKYSYVDWSKYYETFPTKYFKPDSYINKYIDKFTNLEYLKNIESLEVGCNTKCVTKYALDKNIKVEDAENITYEDLYNKKFDFILLRNSISYLTKSELKLLISCVDGGGIIIANTFKPVLENTHNGNEIVELDGDVLNHTLILEDDRIIKHSFFNRDEEFWYSLGFNIERYSETGFLLTYKGD